MRGHSRPEPERRPGVPPDEPGPRGRPGRLRGLVLREEGAVLVLADASGKEQRIDRPAIAESRTTGLSPMPANLGDQLDAGELRDLLAFLLAQRPADAASPR